MEYGSLSPDEEYWKSKQPWLQSCGYQLRSRYQPDWIPSWITDPPSDPVLGPWKREDFVRTRSSRITDAIRLKDGATVILKRINRIGNEYDQEAEISLYLLSPELASDPQNHCVPIYEMLEVPDDEKRAILVMPLLREFGSPRFDTLGECMDFFQQAFEGLQFLHRHHIAHRDCTGPNIMMAGSELYHGGFHPMKQENNCEFTGPAVPMFTRTERPPKYYWIDFGNSVRIHPLDRSPRVTPLHGTDKTAPEFRGSAYRKAKFDPFPTDIYSLGNFMRRYFMEGDPDLGFPRVYGLDFLKPLIDDMVHDDPAKRPTIDQCAIRLDDIIRHQSSWTLRSQVVFRDDHLFGIICRLIPHWLRRLYFIITQTPPIPKRED